MPAKKKDATKATKSFEESLWEAATKLRGSVESSEYKHVVLSLIFLKFVSDKFEERRAELVAEGKGDYVDMVEFYTMRNVFYLPETSRWSYIQQHAKQGDAAIKIDSALTAVEKSNASLKGALPDKYFSRLGLDGSKLSALIDAINNIDTIGDKEEDTGGRVYEYFLGKFADVRRQALGERRSSYLTSSKDGAGAPSLPEFPAAFQQTESMGWIPEGWEVKSLGEESIILNGYAFKSEDYCEDGIFVLRTKNFDANGLSSRRSDDVFLPDSFSDSHESYLSQPFDFHLVMVGASIGKTSLLLPHILPALRNQNMWCFRPKAKSMSKIFLNLSVQKKVEDVMSWASGSARSFFRKSDFRSHEILIPTKELLAQFEETVGSMYLKISISSAEAEQLTKLRDTLLPKLISGELRIPEAEKLTGASLA